MSNIHLARNPIFHARTKHIEVHYHFIQECVLVNDVELQHIGTNQLMDDIFPKALGTDKLWQFTTYLALSTTDQSSLRGS